MENNRNSMIAIGLTVLIVLAWQFFFMGPRMEAQRQEHRERINRLREEFRSRPAKARSDFGIARDYRGPEHER